MENLETWQKLIQISNRVFNVSTSLGVPLETGENPEWFLKDAIKTLREIQKQLESLSEHERL